MSNSTHGSGGGSRADREQTHGGAASPATGDIGDAGGSDQDETQNTSDPGIVGMTGTSGDASGSGLSGASDIAGYDQSREGINRNGGAATSGTDVGSGSS